VSEEEDHVIRIQKNFMMTNYDVSCLLMTPPPAQTFSHRQQLHLCNFAFLLLDGHLLYHNSFYLNIFIDLKKSLLSRIASYHKKMNTIEPSL